MRRSVGVLILALASATACGEIEEPDVRGPTQLSEIKAPYDAWCTVKVAGRGAVDTETDYLPHVVQCENGGAGFEALKAQAIAARSVAYWSMATYGEICDGQQCQVYSCGHEPSDLVRRAVAETAGQYLAYDGVLTYGFYVSGDSKTPAPSCVGDPDGKLENRVTYNDGLFGTDVEQTTLGWVFDPGHAGYGQNRGCMSQWGARCLEGQGRDAAGILRFYYGADIEIVQARGSCAAAPEPPPPEPPRPEPPPPAADDCGVLLPGGSIAPDEGFVSCDGRFTLVPQSDGNLVLYQNGIGALWDTSTHGNTMGGLWMQEDGNLVLYDARGVALWHTSTYGRPGTALVVQDDGNVVLYLGGEALWNSGTCCR